MAGSDRASLIQNLKNLSIPELEALLQQDFLISDGATDFDYVETILEVIQNKEAAQTEYQFVDIEKAWEEFQTFYNTEEGRRYPLYPSGLPENLEQARPAPGTIRQRKVIRRVALAALIAALVIAITVVPVFGYPNVIQMVAHLANGTFRFVPDSSISGDVGNGSAIQPNGTYETLPEALEAYGIYEQVFPQILAEEFEQTELKVKEHTDFTRVVFFAHYENQSCEVRVSVIRHKAPGSLEYERTENVDPEIYTVNKMNYYIFENLDQITISWYTGTLECSIIGDLTLDEAKEIINSIYL